MVRHIRLRWLAWLPLLLLLLLLLLLKQLLLALQFLKQLFRSLGPLLCWTAGLLAGSWLRCTVLILLFGRIVAFLRLWFRFDFLSIAFCRRLRIWRGMTWSAEACSGRPVLGWLQAADCRRSAVGTSCDFGCQDNFRNSIRIGNRSQHHVVVMRSVQELRQDVTGRSRAQIRHNALTRTGRTSIVAPVLTCTAFNMSVRLELCARIVRLPS